MTKILFLDIENSPNLGYVWGKYEQDIIAFNKEWYMLSFSYKWLGEKTVKCFSLPDFSGYSKDKTNDKKLVTELWKLLDSADIVVGHNLDRFDLRKTNARFFAHDMLPPSPFKTVDTYKVAKKHFFFNSNKLNDLSKVGKKVDTGGFGLWLRCMAGDKEAWKLMVKYNKQDIVLTEQLYYELRPWITNHPNLNVLDETIKNCPACGSDKLQRRGFRITRNGKKQAFQCSDCGAWGQGTKNLLVNKVEIS